MLTNWDQKLKGLPERSLTAILLIVGVIAWIIALYGSPTLKLVTLAWMIAP